MELPTLVASINDRLQILMQFVEGQTTAETIIRGIATDLRKFATEQINGKSKES